MSDQLELDYSARAKPKAPIPDNKTTGPMANIRCPACQGPVTKTPTEDRGTVYVAEVCGSSSQYYDDATRMCCDRELCPVGSFYMGCKTTVQSTGAWALDANGHEQVASSKD